MKRVQLSANPAKQAKQTHIPHDQPVQAATKVKYRLTLVRYRVTIAVTVIMLIRKG